MAESVVNGARGRGIQKNEKSFWIFCIFLQIEAYIYYAEARRKKNTRPAREAEMAQQKSFEELTFADNYMF